MTGKEIVRRALNFQDVPRTPVSILDGGIWTVNRAGISFEDMFEMEDAGASLVLQTAEDCRSDIVWPGNGCWLLGLRALGCDAKYDIKGAAGEITSTLIDSLEEANKLDASKIEELLLADKGIQAILRQTKLVSEAVGDSKYIAWAMPAPFTVASQLFGTQDFMVELFDEDNDFVPFLEFTTQFTYVYAKIFLDAGANMIFMSDAVASGDMISPAIFEKFAAPYIKKAFEMIGDQAEVKMLHICGETTARLEPVLDLGVDALSVDSIDLRNALDIAKGSYTIAGNMSPAHVVEALTPGEVYEKCSQLAKEAGLGGGYIMMPGCDITPGTPIENIQAMAQAAHDNKA